MVQCAILDKSRNRKPARKKERTKLSPKVPFISKTSFFNKVTHKLPTLKYCEVRNLFKIKIF